MMERRNYSKITAIRSIIVRIEYCDEHSCGQGETMISTYGLYWKADEVDWGKPGAGNSGTLLGAKSRSKHSRQTDFHDQRGIYALYADYELVYVGQTGSKKKRLFSRLKEHRNDNLAARWNRFSWFGTQWITLKNELSADNLRIQEGINSALNILEAVSIAIAEPKLNRQGGRWGESVQYFQVPLNKKFEDEEE
jgi:hypothetical protein